MLTLKQGPISEQILIEVCDACLVKSVLAEANPAGNRLLELRKNGTHPQRGIGACSLCGVHGPVSRYSAATAKATAPEPRVVHFPNDGVSITTEDFRLLKHTMEEIIKNIARQSEVNSALAKRLLDLEKRIAAFDQASGGESEPFCPPANGFPAHFRPKTASQRDR